MKIGKIKVAPIVCILWIYFVGFVLGVVSISVQQENWLINGDLLNQDFINNIKNINIDKRALFFLVLEKKISAFLLLFLLSFSSLNVFIVIGYFGIHGFAVGSILELLMIRYGIKGSLFYASFVLPQGILYGFAYLVLGCWCLSMENGEIRQWENKRKKIIQKKSKGRVCLSFLLIVLGAWIESLVCLQIFFFFFDV